MHITACHSFHGTGLAFGVIGCSRPYIRAPIFDELFRPVRIGGSLVLQLFREENSCREHDLVIRGGLLHFVDHLRLGIQMLFFPSDQGQQHPVTFLAP
jgi:hypothetical protein